MEYSLSRRGSNVVDTITIVNPVNASSFRNCWYGFSSCSEAGHWHDTEFSSPFNGRRQCHWPIWTNLGHFVTVVCDVTVC